MASQPKATAWRVVETVLDSSPTVWRPVRKQETALGQALLESLIRHKDGWNSEITVEYRKEDGTWKPWCRMWSYEYGAGEVEMLEDEIEVA